MILRIAFLVVGATLVATPHTALAADAAAGKAKAAVCTTCHGANGISQLPNAPHIAGQPEIYLSTQMKAYRDGTRNDPMMSLIAKPLTDADIDDLSAWFSSIQITAAEPQ